MNTLYYLVPCNPWNRIVICVISIWTLSKLQNTGSEEKKIRNATELKKYNEHIKPDGRCNDYKCKATVIDQTDAK